MLEWQGGNEGFLIVWCTICDMLISASFSDLFGSLPFDTNPGVEGASIYSFLRSLPLVTISILFSSSFMLEKVLP
jgi:hypothetical protein